MVHQDKNSPSYVLTQGHLPAIVRDHYVVGVPDPSQVRFTKMGLGDDTDSCLSLARRPLALMLTTFRIDPVCKTGIPNDFYLEFHSVFI